MNMYSQKLGARPCRRALWSIPESNLTNLPRLASQSTCPRSIHRGIVYSSDSKHTDNRRPYTYVCALASGQSEFTSSVATSERQQAVEDTTDECWWPWKWNSKIRYYKAGSGGPPLVLVHGFGVGAYHYEKNLEQLSQNYTVYALELMGQGSSWPSHPHGLSQDGADENEPLIYSTDTWTSQLADFVQQVVGQPAYVAGNSLGGYLSVCLASQHPDLVKGLVLLNSTPFWSMRPAPHQDQGLWGLLGFSGAVPAPQSWKRTIELLWWNNLRSRQTVGAMLSLVYAHKAAVTEDTALVEKIIEATEQPGALDAFVSIVLSPRSRLDFDAMLRSLQCPVSLVYGRQDPWVVPMWGQRATYTLKSAGRPPALYLELDAVGHCPHHEAPAACDEAMLTCLDHMEQISEYRSGRDLGELQPGIAPGQTRVVSEACGRQIQITHVDGSPRILPEYLSHFAWRLADSFSADRLGGTAPAGGSVH